MPNRPRLVIIIDDGGAVRWQLELRRYAADEHHAQRVNAFHRDE